MNIFYMMAGLLQVLCGLAAFGSLVAFCVGFVSRNRWFKGMRWLGGIARVVSLLAFAGVAGCTQMAWGPIDDPKKAFEFAFNRPPPDGIKDLMGIVHFGPDSASFFLQFTTDEATFLRLKPTNVVAVASSGFGLRELPEWWKPGVSGKTQVFEYQMDFGSHERGPHGASSGY